ncbi:hypothetical protein [uncultured Roseobacter sp.]|uniref:hypothetical protein n=1 Tax=uncultured Roseobacter sp. TaxID=114847 RepID=UPI0026388109|nr:hypothetical protein [uncultured Roseobacter sp.]
MALLAGLIVALFLLLAFHLLGWGFRNPRWLIVGLCCIAALYKYGADQLAEDTENVIISAAFAQNCPRDHVRITVRNGGDAAITGLRFKLQGYQRNHSRALATRYDNTDRIIGVNQVWSECWPVLQLDDVDPALHPFLRWEATIRSINLTD